MAAQNESKDKVKKDTKPQKGAATPVATKPGEEKKAEPIRRKKKPILPTHMPTDKIFEDYRRAIDQAVKHATTCNVNPIRGSTVVFCNVSSETKAQSPGAKNIGGSVRSIQDIGYLLGIISFYSFILFIRYSFMFLHSF